MNSASVLSIGVFFTLMIVGLASGLPHALQSGLVAHGVPAGRRRRASRTCRRSRRSSPRSSATTRSRPCSGRTCSTGCRPRQAHALTGRSFFPHLISGPFHTALVYAFVFAIVACLVAAVASLLRGGKYHHVEDAVGAPRSAARAASRRRSRDALSAQTAALRIGEVAERVGVTHADDPLLRGARPARRRGWSARRARTASTPRPTSPACRS